MAFKLLHYIYNNKDRLAIARRSLMDRIVTIVSLTRVLVSCVWLVFGFVVSVVFTTALKSATPYYSKENKQADAGSRLFSKAFSLRRVVVELSMYNRNVQQNPLCAASCVTKDLPVSPRFSPTTFYRDVNSVLLSTPLYSNYNCYSRLYAQNPVFEIVHQESVKVYDTCSCKKRFKINGCFCAARVMAQNN